MLKSFKALAIIIVISLFLVTSIACNNSQSDSEKMPPFESSGDSDVVILNSEMTCVAISDLHITSIDMQKKPTRQGYGGSTYYEGYVSGTIQNFGTATPPGFIVEVYLYYSDRTDVLSDQIWNEPNPGQTASYNVSFSRYGQYSTSEGWPSSYDVKIFWQGQQTYCECYVEGTVKNNGYPSYTDTVSDLSAFAEFYDANGNIIDGSSCANWDYFQMLDHGETRDFYIEYCGTTQPTSYDVWIGDK